MRGAENHGKLASHPVMSHVLYVQQTLQEVLGCLRRHGFSCQEMCMEVAQGAIVIVIVNRAD